MSKIVIIGATGYTGTNITRELVVRGHEVTAVARDFGKLTVEGTRQVSGSIEDLAFVTDLVGGQDVVITAVHHRAHDGGPTLTEIIAPIAEAVHAAGARLGVVGGAGSLRVAENGPRVFETREFPEAFVPEATQAFETLKALQSLPESIDWFYVSPAAGYGRHNVGTRLGHYRLGNEVIVKDEAGVSFISGEDFAIAFVDEIEQPAHKNERFTVGY